MADSWIVEGATCKTCSCPVVITQTTEPGTDYWWYCINRTCPNFDGEQRVDQDDEPDWCDWVRNKK